MFTLFIAITASPVVAQPKVSQVRPARIYKASTGPLKTLAGSGTKASPSQSRGGRWTHALFEKVRGEVQRSAHALLHDRHDAPLVLPLEVNIVLVGFDGDGGFGYELEPDRLAAILRDTFASFRPSRVEDGERLGALIARRREPRELKFRGVHHRLEHGEVRWQVGVVLGYVGDLPGQAPGPRRNVVQSDDAARLAHPADEIHATGDNVEEGALAGAAGAE